MYIAEISKLDVRMLDAIPRGIARHVEVKPLSGTSADDQRVEAHLLYLNDFTLTFRCFFVCFCKCDPEVSMVSQIHVHHKHLYTWYIGLQLP